MLTADLPRTACPTTATVGALPTFGRDKVVFFREAASGELGLGWRQRLLPAAAWRAVGASALPAALCHALQRTLHPLAKVAIGFCVAQTAIA